jgi:hypothetical protein
MDTRAELKTSPQIGVMGIVTNLAAADFKIAGVKGPELFLVKNDGTDTVSLEVKIAKGDTFIATNFAPGWNPELVREIKLNAAALSLKWGY